MRLHLDDEGTIGGLNLTRRRPRTWTPDDEALAEAFAAHAAIAPGHAHERETLNEALQSRSARVIGQAIGIATERYETDEDRAFGVLVRASSQSNIKLWIIAQELVDQRNSP